MLRAACYDYLGPYGGCRGGGYHVRPDAGDGECASHFCAPPLAAL